MSGIIIDKDDLHSIIGALIGTAESGVAALQARPSGETAAKLAGLYDLIARLVKGDGGNADAYEHNMRECTRMVAAFELAKIAGVDCNADIETHGLR